MHEITHLKCNSIKFSESEQNRSTTISFSGNGNIYTLTVGVNIADSFTVGKLYDIEIKPSVVDDRVN